MEFEFDCLVLVSMLQNKRKERLYIQAIVNDILTKAVSFDAISFVFSNIR